MSRKNEGKQLGTIEWGFDDISDWGRGPHRARHRLHEHPAFQPGALADLLDRVPRDIVHPYTMGSDPARTDQWRRGEVTHLSGAQLLEVVERGRLWLNIVDVGTHDPTIADLTRGLYAEITDLAPGFAPTSVKATLLIASPTAQVYYHADNQPNALWHLRGSKRLFVYPKGQRFITDEQLERIVAGVADEQLPYRPELDQHATVMDLEPGDVAWWPQNSPHRVVNLAGLNVSLSTEHRTAASTRRERITASNHALRRGMPALPPSSTDRGLATSGKIALGRVLRRAIRRTGAPGPPPTFEIDPSCDGGVRLTS
ncbi:hypothetical protein [Marihabitans asiaticum]|uniref:hypothetical protein n=1 Tax=Marihabitans asiaticum TaxID=415218 RepID=UPI0011A31F5E|nr:hypothetical protein [Marihabitans asiaticum]